MEAHSRVLEDTAMWKTYLAGLPKGDARSAWIRRVYDSSVEYLKDVRLRFQNYTLHDETHVLNVLDAMAGILGDQISRLTTGEAELLLLAACLHDLGMVYTDDEAAQWFSDKKQTREFLRANCPELLGCPVEDWPDSIRQWYLRSVHPFRLSEVLQNKAWKEIFAACPAKIVSKRHIIAVCQAHGEDPEVFSKSGDMEYLPASDADPLFCALLLRLADLLDFDDTRAPKVLYSYVACNKESREEWEKHQSSGGFRFPAAPSTARLPYKARCTNPGIEHTIRNFLDWIDGELNTCMRLQRKCHGDWQRAFPFPQAVSREEIESEGYVSGDFLMTMDQARVMELLTGEQLYDRNDVFIRELLQNSIDATLLRVEMDRDFSLQEARIDLWEWNDRDGNIWFRIDDQGTGMTQGMLQRYFLKIGNSYYTSQEMKRDLRDHGQTGDYQAISRFGIGFLSCFLCGTFAEVSTLYFDPKKNAEESDPLLPSRRTPDYGLRLQVTGLTGYYTLKSQAEQHLAEEPMPAPDDYRERAPRGLERNGYRSTPGTSISIKLDPGRLGAVNLRRIVDEFLFCAKVPVYYNGERIGRTYEEAMRAVHNLAGERVYEFTPELREKFDKCFPKCAGQYPKVHITVRPLDTEENQVLPDLSGVFVNYDVRFEKTPRWEEKGRHYKITANIDGEIPLLRFLVRNTDFKDAYHGSWNDFMEGHPRQEIKALEAELEKLGCAPTSEDELGEAWRPFANGTVSPAEAWKMWADYMQERILSIALEELNIPVADIRMGKETQDGLVTCSYRGVISGYIPAGGYSLSASTYNLLLLLDGELRPTVKASRSQVSNMPLELMVAIRGILNAWAAEAEGTFTFRIFDWSTPRLLSWRKLRGTKLERWLEDNLHDQLEHILEQFSKPVLSNVMETFQIGVGWPESESVLEAFFMAFIQDNYHMKVNYEAGQIITYADKASGEGSKPYDLFPPMMFCHAATQLSRRYLCSGDSGLRRCITADHPYAVWLLKNADMLDEYYTRQFQQIVDALRNYDSQRIVNICNSVREQLLSFPEHHGVDMGSCPQLSEADFWAPEDEAATGCSSTAST